MGESMELKHDKIGPSEKASDITFSRRGFCKALGVSVLLASLQGGVVGTTLLTPTTAYAQTIQVEGIGFDTERLKDTVDELYRKTSEKCVRREVTLPNGHYVVYANKPNQYTATVSTEPNGAKEMGFFFPADKDKDKDTKGENAGKVAVDIAPFIDAVNKYSKSEVKRFKIIAEETKSDSRGDPVVNGIAIPMDKDGNTLGKYHGGYLAIEMSYFPDRGYVNSGTVLLLEPGVQEPVARK